MTSKEVSHQHLTLIPTCASLRQCIINIYVFLTLSPSWRQYHLPPKRCDTGSQKNYEMEIGCLLQGMSTGRHQTHGQANIQTFMHVCMLWASGVTNSCRTEVCVVTYILISPGGCRGARCGCRRRPPADPCENYRPRLGSKHSPPIQCVCLC